jgi:hypothetical protein
MVNNPEVVRLAAAAHSAAAANKAGSCLASGILVRIPDQTSSDLNSNPKTLVQNKRFLAV